MALTASSAIEALFAYLASQPCPGTLQSLQRAVLSKGVRSLEAEGHWPIMDFPLAIYRNLGGESEGGLALGGACALFYAFADITDDAQDHDLSPEPWEAWGWEQAVNTGSSLLFSCLQYLYERFPAPRAGALVEVFSRAGLEMTYGQHLDLRGQAMDCPSVQAYLQAIEGKSGASFGAYAESVAIVLGQDAEQVKEFRAFGRALGMVFQMLNDTYDLWGARQSSDFANRRLSLPFVLGLEQLRAEPKERLIQLLGGPIDLAHQRELVKLLEAGGIKGYATLRVEVYRKQAVLLAERIGVDSDPYLSRLLNLPAFPTDPIAV